MNIKEFWKKHKGEIVLIGGAIAGITAIYFIKKRFKKVALEIPYRVNCITWSLMPGDEEKYLINLEKVKETLDQMKDTSDSFAIFREGPDPDKYMIILL